MIKIIPAIDIIDGHCVRLTKGDYNLKKVYSSDPVEVARSFEGAGLMDLHLVDLDGARSKHIVNHRVLDRIASSTPLRIDFGGGIQSREDVEIAFNSGASQINCGSIAVEKPETFIGWLREFGDDKLILSADTRNGKVATHAWKKDSGKDLISIVDYFHSKGMKYLTTTDIETDGMLSGPNFELYRNLRISFPKIVITASGGVSSIDDIIKLNADNIDRVIVGKAIYEGKISLEELKEFGYAD